MGVLAQADGDLGKVREVDALQRIQGLVADPHHGRPVDGPAVSHGGRGSGLGENAPRDYWH